MGNLLERFIAERFGERPMLYHGGCNVNQRQEMVEVCSEHIRGIQVFNRKNQIPVFTPDNIAMINIKLFEV